MHPAPSLILLTVASGFGLGLMVFLGLGLPPGAAPPVLLALALVSTAAGLAASTLHLGHPERALLAFTQWRTSWLSREAWFATATLVVFALFAAVAVATGQRPRWLGLAAAPLAAGTLFATSMIYAQLRTVPRWNHWTTPATVLALAAAGGAIPLGQPLLSAALLVVSAAALAAHWRLGDRRFAESAPSRASAVGLPGGAPVRPFEPPHTSPNYVMREMVCSLGRKHRVRLRPIALILAAGMPLLLVLLSSAPPVLALALVLHLAGATVARWLFFAEAEHVVSLYYR